MDMDHLFEIETPYPDLTDLTEDKTAIRLIAPQYAGCYGELTAVLQYTYQKHVFEQLGDDETARILEHISVVEMKHFDYLGEMILKLGALPIYSVLPPYPSRFYSARSVSYVASPERMILADIAAEQEAIASYTTIARQTKNEIVKNGLLRIVEDEKLHLKIFGTLLR